MIEKELLIGLINKRDSGAYFSPMYNYNCSYGNLVVWDHLERCVRDEDHLIGLILGVLAVPIWTSAHVGQYLILRSGSKSSNNTRVISFVFTPWFADCIGVVSAFLAQQWLSQIIFGLCALLVHTLCCLHYLVVPLHKKQNIVSLDKKLVKNRYRFKSCPHMLSLLFLPAVILMLWGRSLTRSDVYTRAINQQQSGAAPDFEIPHLVGYIFGSLAGVLHCTPSLIDMIESYITVESSIHLITMYAIRVVGECAYVSSVFIQSENIYSYIHTLPWTVPRLIAAGLNIGILIQRCIQRKKGKRRKLSREDTECLISSESDIDFHTDSEEEVIWMPLRSVQSAIPSHPVCISRVQILSETDVPPEMMTSDEKVTPCKVSDLGNSEENESDSANEQEHHID